MLDMEGPGNLSEKETAARWTPSFSRRMQEMSSEWSYLKCISQTNRSSVA